MTQHFLPMRLKQDLAIQQVGDETLVYDERRHLAFCLNRVAAAVWNQCDGNQDAHRIAAKLTPLLAHPVSVEIVELALAQLAKDALLEASPLAALPVDVAAISRRSLIARAGAGAVMMLPVIAAIAAPRAAQAYSGGVDGPNDDPARDGSIPADPGEPKGGSSPL